MRLLHLFGDYKWTGPAEPTVNLCLRLREMGHDVRLACCPAPDPRLRFLETKAREAGLDPITDFNLNPGLRVDAFMAAVRGVSSYIRSEGIDICHVHQGRDHLVGGLAARQSHTAVRVVRSNHRAEPLADGWRSGLLLRGFTDGLIEISQKAAERDRKASGLSPEVVGNVDGVVDVERFGPDREFSDVRPRFGLEPGHVVVGIVARLQRHRRFELFLQAMKIASDTMPALRALVVGRGTYMKEVGVEPARRMGLGDTVTFAGYVDRDFEATVAMFDMKVYLVPGSDGSCRAVLETMALGKPVIAARRGILPEIIEDGRTGLLVDDDPKALADAILRLAGHPAERRRMGLAARAEAVRRFTADVQAERVARVYRNVCPEAGGSP